MAQQGCVRAGCLALWMALCTPLAAQPLPSFDFQGGVEPWVVMGQGARIERATADLPAGARSALAYRYELGRGQLQSLVLPLSPGQLGSAGRLRFQARAAQPVSLVVSVEEQGGGRWTANLTLPGGRWTEVELPLDDLSLATDAGDPPDANGRLDLPRLKQLSMVDAAAFLAAALPDAARMFGVPGGSRTLLVANLRFEADKARPPSVDGFERDTAGWMVLGTTDLQYGRSGPLKERGLALRYERRKGAALGLFRRLPAGTLDGVRRLDLSLASAKKATLLLKLEQSDGGKFETLLNLPGEAALQTRSVRAEDFKRSDDGKRGLDRLDWARVTQLSLLEAGGLFTAQEENQLWLASVQAGERGAPAAAAPSTSPVAAAAAPTAATATAPAAAGWAPWVKRVRPILSGPFSLVGDPSVIRDGDVLRMAYNCFDPQRKRGAICVATSTDGLDWRPVANSDANVPGRVIKTRPGEWDDAQETPFLLQYKGEYLLYFIGYRDRGGFMKSFPAYVGLAVSKDGVNFERVGTEPVLKTTAAGFDNDSISSPSVVEHEGKLVMLYTAHCWTRCPKGTGVTLLAASSDDGRRWTKTEEPVLTKASFPSTKDGIAETEVKRGPDNQYYLFTSLLYGDNGHEIGVARAPSPFGPWDINPSPIVLKSKGEFDAVGPIAPTVVFEGGRVRMWYHGFSGRNTIEIGYAQAPWPLRLK